MKLIERKRFVNNYILPNILLIVGAIAIIIISPMAGGMMGMAVAAIPFALFMFVYLYQNPKSSYLILFVVNYTLMGLSRYIPNIVPMGTIMDGYMLFIIITLLIQNVYKKVEWKNSLNLLTLLALTWVLYCFSLRWGPEALSGMAWFTAIRGVALYFLVIVILVPVIFKDNKDLKNLLILWGLLIILAGIKTFIQKNFGFDTYEWRWLYERGGHTHLLSTGTRYFSFFTDAANFGTGMAFSMLIFSIIAFFEENKKLKIFYLIVAIIACYGMMQSGTRTAMAVPFIGYTIFVILSKNVKVIIGLSLVIGALFVFFKFTYIGQNVQEIRRMRSAFNPNDASKIVRERNQALFKIYMKDKPFGVGIGHSGRKGQEYVPESYIAKIPTDSWYVFLWVETGIVGLILYLTVMVACILYGCFLVFFKLKDRKLRAMIASFIAGITGLLIASSNNEVFAQFPNGIIVYTLFAFVFMSPKLDKQILDGKVD